MSPAERVARHRHVTTVRQGRARRLVESRRASCFAHPSARWHELQRGRQGVGWICKSLAKCVDDQSSIFDMTFVRFDLEEVKTRGTVCILNALSGRWWILQANKAFGRNVRCVACFISLLTAAGSCGRLRFLLSDNAQPTLSGTRIGAGGGLVEGSLTAMRTPSDGMGHG
jgi:hypothetical protein